MTIEIRLQEFKRFEEQTKAELEANKKAVSELRQMMEEANRQNRERDAVLLQIQQALGWLLKEKGLPDDAPAAFQTPPRVEEAPQATNVNASGHSGTATSQVNATTSTYPIFLNPVMAKATLTSQTRNGKVEFPVFDGSTGVRRWIFQAEQFLVPNQSPPEVMSQIASLNMGGEAL